MLLFILHRFFQNLDVCVITRYYILRLVSAFSLLSPIIRLLPSAMICRSEITLIVFQDRLEVHSFTACEQSI
nr:MAG TPA: hypothetical protein [Caudoviricetes sp.]